MHLIWSNDSEPMNESIKRDWQMFLYQGHTTSQNKTIEQIRYVDPTSIAGSDHCVTKIGHVKHIEMYHSRGNKASNYWMLCIS